MASKHALWLSDGTCFQHYYGVCWKHIQFFSVSSWTAGCTPGSCLLGHSLLGLKIFVSAWIPDDWPLRLNPGFFFVFFFYKKLQFLFCFTISKELCIKAELTVVPNKPNIYSVAIKVLPLKEDSVYWMQITPMECAQTDVVVPLPCLMRACISVSPQHPGNSASMPLGFSFISAFCGHWTHGALQAWGLFLPLVSQVPFLMIWK